MNLHSSHSVDNSWFQLHTGARLHLGLVEIKPDEPNCYGGFGLMIDSPRATLTFQKGDSNLNSVVVESPPYWKERIEKILSLFCSGKQNQWLPLKAIHLEYEETPHQGLGSGTQVGAMVAHAILACESDSPLQFSPSMQSLSLTSQRGLRSFIGLAGYLHGGAVVDLGRKDTSGPRTSTFRFPDWPILLVRSSHSEGAHGENEKELFELCSRSPNPFRAPMLQTIAEELVPAMQTTDWNRWDAHAGRYGFWAGKIFEQVQGGIYRSDAIQKTIEAIHAIGCQGATQSSWGPVVLAVARDSAHAESMKSELLEWDSTLSIEITCPKNVAASLTPFQMPINPSSRSHP